MKSAYRSNRFRHSITERPMLRVRFTDPDGRAQHCTMNSTWTVCDDEAIDGSGTSRPTRDIFIEKIGLIYQSLGCTVQGIEVVSTEILDI